MVGEPSAIRKPVIVSPLLSAMLTRLIKLVFLPFVFILLHAWTYVHAETAMCIRLFDYQKPGQSNSLSWRLVNDDVMGGRSIGRFAANEDHLAFSGFINTDGGGFSSIRLSVPSLPFFGFDHIRMSVRSDGRPYTLSLADEFSVRQGISHRAIIDAGASADFREVEISKHKFSPMFRGRMVQAPQLNTNAVQELRVMLSDFVDGDFRIDLQWIDVCR